MNFWEEMAVARPDFHKLDSLAALMYTTFGTASERFEKLLHMNPYSVETLRLYARFLLQVVNDTNRATALLQQADEIEAALSQKQSDESVNLVFFSKVRIFLCTLRC